MRELSLLLTICLALVFPAGAAAADAAVEKLTFGSGGSTRAYYLFIPEKAAAGNAPLLLLLHGFGRTDPKFQQYQLRK